MRKILKSCLVILAVVCLSFSFVGCKKKVSPTTTNVDNVKSSNGATTNGGMTVVYGDYLYFINGSKDNDGTSPKKNKRSAICRVKYNMTTGETEGDIEVVVDELVGFSNGSLNIFGDYLYYTTPCADENYKGEVLYYKTCFKRYDLVNKKSYLLYTTELNNKDETIDFAYYVVNDTLNLVVYETKNSTIKSMKIDKKVTLNYTISGVTGCTLSENYGKPTTSASVDANSFVFYTKAPDTYDYPQTGNKVYKTSPVTDDSKLISQGKAISLLSIRSGKLLYSYNKFVYAQAITAGDNVLLTENTNCISRSELTNAIYLENYSLQGKDSTAKLVKSEGSITVLTFDSTNLYFSVFEWTSSTTAIEDNHTNISLLESAKDFEFIGLTKLEEIVTKDDPETENVNEETKRTVLYALYRESSKVYKVEIAEVVDENTMKVSIHTEKVKLSDSTLSSTNGLLLPEAVGNYLFILSEDDDKNNYLIKVDLTPTETVDKKSDKFALAE